MCYVGCLRKRDQKPKSSTQCPGMRDKNRRWINRFARLYRFTRSVRERKNASCFLSNCTKCAYRWRKTWQELNGRCWNVPRLWHLICGIPENQASDHIFKFLCEDYTVCSSEISEWSSFWLRFIFHLWAYRIIYIPPTELVAFIGRLTRSTACTFFTRLIHTNVEP